MDMALLDYSLLIRTKLFSDPWELVIGFSTHRKIVFDSKFFLISRDLSSEFLSYFFVWLEELVKKGKVKSIGKSYFRESYDRDQYFFRQEMNFYIA